MGRVLHAVALPIALLLAGCTQTRFEPPERSGPIGLVDTGSGKQAWLATTQEEERSRHVGGGRHSIGRLVTEYHYHLRLQAHDASNAQRLWVKELRVLRDKEGGMGAQIRVLGQQGEVVWVWVHDQALALSARDGAVLADRAALEQANPDVAAMLPRDGYAFALPPSDGQAGVVGLRPESVQPATGQTPAGGEPFVLTLKPLLTEHTGSDNLVVLAMGDQEIVGKFPTDPPPKLGELVAVGFDLSRLSVFDATTERRL